MSAPFAKKLTAVLVALAATAALAGCGGATPDNSRRSLEAGPVHASPSHPGEGSATEGAGPVAAGRVEHGVPVGWPLDQAGAEAAASAYLRSTSLVARSGPLTRRDVVLTMATSSYGPTMVAAVNRELDGLIVGSEGRSVTPQELVWIEYPLAVTSTMVSTTTAQVEVWSVLIVGVEGGSVARQVWHTSTIRLEVEDDDWKIADWVDTAGPTPVALNDTDIASVADLDEVTSWAWVGGTP